MEYQQPPCSCAVRPRTVYLGIGDKHEVVTFHPSIASQDLKELFRTAANAEPGDIIKLFTHTGQLISISNELPFNTPDTRYSLQVVGVAINGMIQRELGVNLVELQHKVIQLEKSLHSPRDEHVSGVLADLRQQVENFRGNILITDHNNCQGGSREGCSNEQKPNVVRTTHKYAPPDPVQRQRVKEKFLEICDTVVTEEVRANLRKVEFDSRDWEDEELLLLLQQMYYDLDLISTFAMDIRTLREFLFAVYDCYNDVPFHNFRHCFCVAQMMYTIAWAVDLRACVGDFETLILITSCICHDLDHPGYNNIYQINARTDLAVRYNDISPLENHHCSVTFQILRRPECNIFKHFSTEEFGHVREGIIRCILATDMARHNEILQQFREIKDKFDFENVAHLNLLSMVLIKVADISNEARPMEVAEPWLDRLLQEFFRQSDTEKLEGLPVTPFMDRDKVTKPSSQCSFIGLVLLPLFESLGELLPVLKDMIVKPVHAALEHYRRLNEAAKERKSLDLEERRLSIAEAASGAGTSMGTSESSSSPHPSRSSRQSCITVLRSEDSVSEDLACVAAAMDSTADEEEDTITEVEVSEKTLKFKISTETAPNSNNFRKRSFDKQTSFEEKSFSTLQQQHNISPASILPQANNDPTPVRNSFFARLKGFKERLYGNYEKSPEKLSLKNLKKDACSLERRRSSTSSIAELKQSVSDDMGNGKSSRKDKLSGSLDCVLAGTEKHSSKKKMFFRFRSRDKSPSTRSPGSKVAAFVGSFRKRGRDDK